MGYSKLCLLLLLSTSALAFAQDDDHPPCLLAKRYNTLHKYKYQYEAESLNAINGASTLKNGPKAACTVEIEVPQTCSFIVRTTGCSLSEVVDTDKDGNPVFGPAPSSDDFAAEMEKYPLKFVVEGVYNVKLYPEDGETTTILNIKRGIISAMAVPLVEEDKNENMPTIHGKCKTYYKVNAREDIATDISLNRDLSTCDRFVPMRDYTSPLALISGMHYPLAQLIRSSQTCNYRFDNKKKHMTSGSCTENHILIPFSYNGEYGVTNVGKQELTLVQVSPHNDRVFEHSDMVKGLHMEAVEDKNAVQDKDAAVKLLRELATLPETEGETRAHLFQKLVTMVRGMKAENLSPAIPEVLAVSPVLTYQVLAQCGTPECSSAIMQILRTFDRSSLQVDATVFAMGLISNPSALLIHDMLQMARYKTSKPIMYALSNVVKRFYKGEGKAIPEIHSVAEFMAAQLGDCSSDNNDHFRTLRVIGNMAPAVVPISPALRAAVIQCVNQPAAPLAVQQAAIQVYRLTPVPKEDREVLMKVLLADTNPTQKRIAAYLVLMKDPQPSELIQLTDALPNEQDIQVKSFVISHINNILTSTEPETQELRRKIRDVLQRNEIGPIMDYTKFSRNYKIWAVEGNMIFEGTGYLPREVMLEMTLKAFGFDIDMMEIGVEGKGFEPTVDALFGENGFFPDTALKTMYFVSDNMPLSVSEILHNVLPALKKDRMKRQTSHNLMREIEHNIHKLMRELETSHSPEAMIYLRLLGNELGYLTTKEMERVAYSAARIIESIFEMLPINLIATLVTRSDNTIFAHYIFMDNKFFLPTVTGVPLRVALSGTFTPGIKGGLKISRGMTEVSFMPSAGIEFVTQFGSSIPEYVNSGLEMHTNIFHESGLSAKISMARDQVQLAIPAPMSPTKLFKMTNTLVAVTGSEVQNITPIVMDKVDVSECTPVFAGMKYCTAVQYTDAFSQETSPYFPFTGNSKFEVELYPTGEVTQYTATVAYELLREGEERRAKVDSVKFTLKAEGAEPTEARAILKYNRRKNVITADIQIPDYDVEAGVRLGVVDGNTKGKGTHSVALDFINKNIRQLSLVGRANLKAMKEGMLQVQLLVLSVNVDAAVTAKMKRDKELELELESEIKFMDATSEQKITMIYDDSRIEVEFKSEVETETNILPSFEVLEKHGDELLNTQVGQTDMKVRDIFKTFVEAANNYMEKYGADMPEISLPETLFLKIETKAAYHFNNEHFTIAIPLPLGGKSSEELNFPQALTTPSMSLPQFGLEIVSVKIPMPEFVVPESLSLSIPLFSKAGVSTSLRSNLYTMEASMAVKNDHLKIPSCSVKFDVNGISPLDILSIKMEGVGMLAITDSIQARLKSSLTHKFIEISVSIVEDANIINKVHLKSSSRIEAKSPFGLNFSLDHTGLAGFNNEVISAGNNFAGMVKFGPMYAITISNQSLTIFPFRPEAMIDSNIQIDSTIFQAQNKIAATLANGIFSVMSNTSAFEDILKHVVELSFKDRKLSLKCDASALALGMKIHNQAQASASAKEIVMRIETNSDYSENRVYSLLTASLNNNGLGVISNASVKLFENEATHKAALTVNKDGLTTSGTTIVQSPLSLENNFNAEVDASKGTLSITNKAAMHDIKVNNVIALTITLFGLDFNSKVEATASEFASYTHDITIDLTPCSASANVNNNLKLLAASFINEARLKAEPNQMDLTGNLKARYGPEEIKHTYQVNYADMTTTAKCTTTGKVFGTHMNHNTELKIVGLAASITNDARFNSKSMRFDHSIRCSIVPFDINLDAIFSADGDIIMYGKHSAQLYGKFLLKAQPLAFASSHDCRASVTQMLDNNFSLETTFDNKMNTVLSLQEQKTTFRLRSKMNEHAFNQDMSIYNIAERTGTEVSGTILTNILNSDSTENQEFTISGFLKYDKNTDSHIIQFPLTENLPDVLESIEDCVVHIAEALQFYINIEELTPVLEDLFQHITLPEVTVPEISFPTIPHVPIEKLKSLQLPEIKLPAIPSDVMVPCFGKLHGEIKFLTPIYTVKMSAEFQNSTEKKITPQFTGFLSSQATSLSFKILNYKLDTTTRIAIPKMSRVVLAETMKFNHVALGVEHQASVSLYGQSGQAQSKTAVEVTTTPYTANIVNTAFIAVEGGMSASLHTTYTHLVDLPNVNVRSEANVTHKSVAQQDGLTFTLTADNSGTGKVNTDHVRHKSNLQLSLSPSISTLTVSSDTASTILNMKQQITAEMGTLSYFKFNVHNEADAPIIKNSLLVASGQIKLHEMKVELKANHDTELHGEVSGVLSNGINVVVDPTELVCEFQNRGKAKVIVFKDLSAKIHLQNDYSAIFRPDSQKVTAVALAHLNEYKVFCNFTGDNNENEAGIFLAMESFTDVNLHYAAGRNGISASLSTPFTGLLGLQFNGRVPSQMSTRVYGHFPSAPEVDVEILAIRSSSKDADKIKLQIAYNMEAHKVMVSELKMRLKPSVSAFTMFAEDRIRWSLGVLQNLSELTLISEACHAATHYDIQNSPLIIFFNENIVDMLINVVDQFNNSVYDVLQQVSEEAQGYMKVSERGLEIDLAFPFQQ